MRIALYEFIILYKPGKENFLADFLSRLNEETPAEDADEENDYHDQLVASIEVLSIEQSIKEPWQKTELDEIKLEEKETLNIHVISQEPNSENQHEYISYREEQDPDEDIIWIKNLILKHEDKKPVINQFDNEVRRILYKEYN